MRKFKHKKTKYQVMKVDDNWYQMLFIGGEKSLLPASIVENSNDWEEIIEKKPLFVTEDGVEVFEGGDYWYILINSPNPNWIPLKDFVNWKNPKTNPLGAKQFSTREAAQKYIDLHKPKYSLKDVEEALCNHGIELFKYDIIEHLKNVNK